LRRLREASPSSSRLSYLQGGSEKAPRRLLGLLWSSPPRGCLVLELDVEPEAGDAELREGEAEGK